MSIFLVFLLLVQCNENRENPIFIENIIFNEKKELNNYDALYVLPPTLCASCNSPAQKIAYLILKENYRAKVIFECFPEDFKVLNFKLKQELVYEKHNYLIDTMLLYNQFDSLSLVNAPIVIYLDNGKILNFEILDKENPQVLNTLINKLSN